MMSFEWSLPTNIVFGLGRLKSAHKYVRGLGKRAFIVTSRSFGPGGTRNDVLRSLCEQLDKIDVEYEIFHEIEPNPRTDTIDRAAERLRAFGARYIIGFGGGSVLDASKCLALLGKNSGGIFEYAYRGAPSVSGAERRSFNDALPLVCIPSNAAAGSETDQYAVVTNWNTHRKVTVFGKSLQPTLSIVDPELTFSVPRTQTIDGAFDMITHVMETYLSTRNVAFFQDRMTEAFVESVVFGLRRVLENPADPLGRSQLSWCAAFALSGTFAGREGGWPIHSLEHGLSAWTDVAHGRGLAMLLPRVMQFDAQVIGDKIRGFNERVFGVHTGDADEALERGLVAFMKEVGACTTLGDLGVKGSTAVDTLAAQIADHSLEVDAVWKKGEEPYLENIRPMKRADILQIVQNCAV